MQRFLPAVALTLSLACNRNVVQPSPPSAGLPPENHAPHASLSAPTTGVQGVELTLDGRESSDVDKDTLVYLWDFSDNTRGSGPVVTHIYAVDGSYTVTLIVGDSHGATDTARATVRINRLDPAGYEVIDLGTLGGNSSVPLAINDRGQVVGRSVTAAGESHAFLWERGVMRDLAPELPSSEASVVTNSGVIGGLELGQWTPSRILVWQGDVVKKFGATLGFGSDIEHMGLVGINEAGDVVGWVYDGHHQHAIIWREDSKQFLGGLLRSGGPSNASHVNEQGQIVGSAMTDDYAGDEVRHPFIWENGVMRDLGILGDRLCDDGGPSPVPCGGGSAADINNSGVAVGTTSDTSWGSHAVMWSNGTIRDLGRGQAIAINEAGDIIGYTQQPILNDQGEVSRYGGDVATFWDAGVRTAIGSLGGGGTMVEALNDAGMVTGVSLNAAGRPRVFVWRRGEGMVDLGGDAAGGPRDAFPLAINAQGDIIGFTASCVIDRNTYWATVAVLCHPDEASRAILWRRKTVVAEASSPSW